MHHQYPTRGVCPMSVAFDLEGDTVHNIEFTGGCNGNLKAVPTLVEGMTVDQICEKLAGNTSGSKSTSCADQLCQFLVKARGEEQAQCLMPASRHKHKTGRSNHQKQQQCQRRFVTGR